MDDIHNSIVVGFGFADHERLQFTFSAADLARSRTLHDDWLEPTVSICAGPFSGAARVYLNASDFAHLLPQVQRLYTTLRGIATFESIEGQVAFTLTGDAKGHIELAGFLKDRAGGHNSIQFRLFFDQTALPRSITQIEALLRATAKRSRE